MTTSLRDKTAIVGVGATPQGRLPGSTALTLAVDAFKNALEDSGLRKEEIDGLLTFPGTTAPEGALNYLRVGEALGINPRFTGSMVMGGGTAGALVQQAVMAVETGMADVVACVFGDAAKTGGSRFSRASGWGDPWSLWGMYGAAANSGVAASRHMALYGTTSEQLGAVAVACRKHASLNPNAVMRDLITIEDHQASRWIVEPLHLLDCCLISDGGVCIIVTSAERAKTMKQPPVYISGMGQAYTNETVGREDWWYVPHQKEALARAFQMAGAKPSDIDVAQLYDNFTISVILWLEHAGFCGVGEGGSFVEGGRIELGGELPVNTAGGNLSESYMEGWLHIVEGVRQIRGQGDARQVEDAELCLVTGRGMSLNTSNAMILSKNGVSS
ncbi:acetyl-CoA acetyltransferase [Arthrobacter ginsengisoli]|uniref:Acetyl-CoA acetyltransferase n=1 Tax=Arthrobacter ginsengisoli TaxID=1356565 RepID=A0ABU1UDR3_9MICC|nr:thiolase family protein [Arthrobacter ginsengisoli]MDR7083343.1 acetyl-CoA acetyltransferase [Arthrobacter ginsengisoli]